MTQTDTTALHAHLAERRDRLRLSIGEAQQPSRLVNLLMEVDAALERLEKGTYGICEVCHDDIEPNYLRMDPLVRVCLGHLTEDRQRALERDLELASTIQGQLLPPRRTSLAGWDIAFHYEPAGVVSGDYCDIVRNPQNAASALFMVGDVSGKGVAASLMMMHLHGLFRSLADADQPVARLMERVNRVFVESTMSLQFATVVCGRTFSDGNVELCVAGHCPPLLVHQHGVTPIEPTGLPVGVLGSTTYQQHIIRLSANDTLIVYTDGVTEACNPSGEEYGEKRLRELLHRARREPVDRLLDACRDDHRAFRSADGAGDDITLLALRKTT